MSVRGPKPVVYEAANGRTVEVYPEAGNTGDWRYRVKAGNGQTVGGPQQGYSRKDGALRAARREHPPKPRIR